MKKIAIYPGTFDPITYGHIDVIKKALKLFDKVIVAASDGNNKNYLFHSEERIEIINKSEKITKLINKKDVRIFTFFCLIDICFENFHTFDKFINIFIIFLGLEVYRSQIILFWLNFLMSGFQLQN